MKTILMLILVMFLCLPVYAQQASVKTDPAGEKSAGIIKLNLENVIQGVVKRNLDVRKAVIDYGDAGIDLQRFLGQYDTFAFGRMFSQYKQLSKDDPSLGVQAYQAGQKGAEAGLQKSFSTGTTVQASVAAMHQDLRPLPVVSDHVKGYSNSAGVTLSQELLRNAFGMNQRRIEKSLEKASEIKKRAARQAVADTVLVSFSAYWNCIIAQENLKTAQIALQNTNDIRNLIKRKSAVGISEREELYDWEGRVLLAQNSVEGARVENINAKLAILRALDYGRDCDIEIVKDLVSSPPAVNLESAIAEAFKKRTDLANLHQALEISELSLASAKNSSLPSLTASSGLGFSDYNRSLSHSYSSANPQWFVSLGVSQPLEGTAVDAEIQSAKNALLKQRIEVRQLEGGIRDEIQVRLAQCNAAYKIYRQTAQSADYAQKYYESIFRKFSQGRYETTYLKLSFDNFILLRTSALKSLVDYNIALLQLDIAQNTVFEKYSIDVHSIVAGNPAGSELPVGVETSDVK